MKEPKLGVEWRPFRILEIAPMPVNAFIRVSPGRPLQWRGVTKYFVNSTHGSGNAERKGTEEAPKMLILVNGKRAKKTDQNKTKKAKIKDQKSTCAHFFLGSWSELTTRGTRL